MIDFKNEINTYFQRAINVINNLNIEEINDAMNEILRAHDRCSNIYIFGNGGSSATASHFVCDFNKGISENINKKFNLICLNDNTSIMTAIANDIGYDEVFSYQLKDKLTRNDLVIAISGSGNSKNIIKAVEYCKQCEIKVIGVTGYSGGRLKELSDYRLHVNVDDMQITEDIHMVFDHMMMRIFKDYLEKL